jgi:hypothetical protein
VILVDQVKEVDQVAQINQMDQVELVEHVKQVTDFSTFRFSDTRNSAPYRARFSSSCGGLRCFARPSDCAPVAPTLPLLPQTILLGQAVQATWDLEMG